MSAKNSAVSSVSLPSYFSTSMQQLHAWQPAPAIAVACSGGADSLALTLLAHEWAQARNGQVTALIIDHGLRDESAKEAAQTATWLAARNIQHHVISLTLDAKKAAIQERARDARYQALQHWCEANRVAYLLTGHHADDQLETMLFRLLRGSGIHGLAAMSARRAQKELTVLRPLMNLPKAALTDYLHAQNQPWIEDSSNGHEQFARVRMRNALSELSANQRQRLTAINRAFGQMRQADEQWLFERAQHYCTALPYGVLEASRALLNEPREVAIWLLKHLLTTCHGTPYPPRQHEVEQLYNDLLTAPDKTRSLHSCLVMAKGEQFIICREPARTQAPLALRPNQTTRWDNRFHLQTSANLPEGCHIAALGKQGVAHCKANALPLPNVPHQALLSLPAIMHLEAPLILPHIYPDDTKDEQKLIRLRFAPAKLLADAPFFIMNDVKQR